MATNTSLSRFASRLRMTWKPIGLWVCAAALAACQTESAAHLPPMRLGPPTIVQTGSLRPPMAPQPVVPRPAPIAKGPTPAPRQQSAAAVPAGWIPAATVNEWYWIVIHHSDSDYGSAAIIDKWHRDRGFDELGYHFVIGNGTNTADGQIEVGQRWTKQKWGAHDNAMDNRFNEHGIGICLVGNFNNTRPTAAQRKSLIKLVVYLMETYKIPPSHILGHGETKVTQCPGRYLSASEIRSTVAQMLASNEALPAGELLTAIGDKANP